MAQVSKFALVFDVEGNYEDAFTKISGLFNNATSAAASMAVNVRDANQAIETAMNSLRAVSGFGERIMGAGLTYFGAIADFGRQGVQSIQPLEAMMQRMQGVAHATRDQARDIVANAIQLAEQTPFLAEDVSSLSSALAIAKVDLGAFRDEVSGASLDIGLAAQRGFAKLPQEIVAMGRSMKVTASSMLADIATVAGVGPERMQFFVAGMQRALTTGNLRMLDELPPTFKKAIFGSITQSQIPAQKAMENLFHFLAKEGQIGAALAGSTTLSAIQSNFMDLPGKLFRNVFGMPGTGGFYDQFKDLLTDVYTSLSSVFADPDFLDVLKNALRPVLDNALHLAKVMVNLGKQFLVFVKEHPQVAKYGVIFLGIASSIAVATGFAIKLASGLGLLALGVMGLQYSFVTWGAGIKGVLGLLGSLGMGLGIIIAAAAAVYLAYTTNFAGIGDIIDKTLLGVRALWEGMRNMTRTATSLSDATASALARAGILDFVLSLLSWGNRLYNFFTSVAEGFAFAFSWGERLAGVTAAFGYLSTSLGSVFTALGHIITQVFGTTASFQSGSNAGAFLGIVLGNLVTGATYLVQGLAVLAGGLAQVVSGGLQAADIFGTFLWGTFNNVKTAAMGLYNAFGLLFQGDFIGFFKSLGSTLVSYTLKPFQLLAQAITSVMDALGKGDRLGAGLRAFAKGALPGTLATAEAPASTFKMPTALMAANLDVPLPLSAPAQSAMTPVSNVLPISPRQIRRGANPAQMAAIQNIMQSAAESGGMQTAAQVRNAFSGVVNQAAPQVQVQVQIDGEHVASRMQSKIEGRIARQVGG